MHHLDLRLGGRRYLICDPGTTPDGRPSGYGNILRHAAQSIRTAAALRASLFFVHPERSINPALYDLDSPDVRIISQRDWRARWLRMLWSLSVPARYGSPLPWLRHGVASGLRPVVEGAKHLARRLGWRTLDRRLDKAGHALRTMSHEYEKRIGDRWHRVFAEARERARETGSKRHPVRLRVRPDAQAVVDRLARDAGLDPARPMVAWHVRESGFRQRGAARQQNLDRIREGRIETYREAVEWLVERGYQVVRIGDSTMTPCPWPGVVDLATAPWRTGAFELWAVINSRFFVASDSGPYFLAQLGGVPTLTANVIQVGYYTLRPPDRYVCKRVVDHTVGRHLSISEMLTEQFVRNPLAFDRYEWVDNTAEDIREAVEDLVQSLARPAGERTPAQQHHDQLLATLAAQWKPEWRSRRSLLFRRGGPGTISARFAARYLDLR